MIAKKCKLCGRILPVTMYYKHKNCRDNLRTQCKKCLKVMNYYWSREKRKDNQKNYYQKNKKERQSYQRKYYELNRDRYKEHKATYIKKHLDRYYGKQRKSQIKRRFKTNGDVIVTAEVIERYGTVCYLCGEKVLSQDMHLDHVIPLSRGGKHELENIRVTHAFCNLSKGNKLPEEIGVAI